MRTGVPVVIGVDEGTTQAGASAVDATGRAWSDGAAACEFRSPAQGLAVQDWRQLRATAVLAIRGDARDAMVRGARSRRAHADGGSSYGAAVLGREALAMIDSVELITESMEMRESREPDERSSTMLRPVRPPFVSRYYALRPAFRAMQSRWDPGECGSALARAESEHAEAKSTWRGTQ